jgi:hypothetical protein
MRGALAGGNGGSVRHVPARRLRPAAGPIRGLPDGGVQGGTAG